MLCAEGSNSAPETWRIPVALSQQHWHSELWYRERPSRRNTWCRASEQVTRSDCANKRLQLDSIKKNLIVEIITARAQNDLESLVSFLGKLEVETRAYSN